MGKVSQCRVVIERFVSSDRGQRFFNVAYSIGAAIVIWGALFKLLHIRGGDLLLCIAMGTEVIVFILTAFDRPPREYKWEEVFPALDGREASADQQPVVVESMSRKKITNVPAVEVTPAVPDVRAQKSEMPPLSGEIERLRQEISDNSGDYVEQMQTLNRNIQGLNTIYEIQLKSVSSQLDAIDRVNKGIKEMSAMYETTLSQSSRYCEESEKMTQYMEQLNQVYEKMLRAMTVNMSSNKE